MIRVISSPSSSTTGRCTLILLTARDAMWTPMPGVSSICFTAFVATISDLPRGHGAPRPPHAVLDQPAQPELAAEWEPRLMARTYDPELRAPGEKASAIAGMAMTEKQGGSDVRANTTVATPLNGGGGGGEYEITGHKWFCSAPMSDIFLVLAQTIDLDPPALSCFLLPRILPDGSRNAFHIQRLKDK